jgi:hypothetical protein
MYRTRFCYIVFGLSCICVDETRILFEMLLSTSHFFSHLSAVTKVCILTCCRYLWQRFLACLSNPRLSGSASTSVVDAGRCWCRRRECLHPCILMLDSYGDEVVPFSPVLLVCYVWLLQMVIHCILWNARIWLGTPWENLARIILWNGGQMWMYVHVCIT